MQNKSLYLTSSYIIQKKFDKALHFFNKSKKTNISKLEDIFIYSGLYKHLLDFYDFSKICSNRKIQFKNINNYFLKKSLITIEESYHLSNILLENNIPHLFVKGAAVHSIIDIDLSYRPLSDIDVHIEKKFLNEAILLLLDQGYRFNDEIKVNKKKWVGSTDENAEIQLRSSKNVLIEIHSRLFNIDSYLMRQLESEMIDTCNPSQRNISIATPKLEMYFLHIIYNYCRQTIFRSGIKILVDFHEVKDLDIALLIELASKYKMKKQTILFLKILEEVGFKVENFKTQKYIVDNEIIEDASYLLFENRFTKKLSIYREKTNIISKCKFIFNDLIPSKDVLSHNLNVKINNANYIFFLPIFFLKRLKELINKSKKFKKHNLALAQPNMIRRIDKYLNE